MSVPMIVKIPHQVEGAISDTDVRSIDILPTVLDALSIDSDWELDGRSVYSDPTDRGPKAQMRTDGVVIEADPMMPAWDVALLRKVRRFKNAEADIDVYNLGNAPLVGSNVSSVSVADESIGTVQVDALGRIEEPDSPLGLSPTHVTGTIRLADATDNDIVVAVAVNRVIQLVGPLIEPVVSGGKFSYFVPEEAFGPTTNSIAFYVLEGSEESPLLIPLVLEEARLYTTSVHQDGKEYLESDHAGIPINDRLSGTVDKIIQIGSVYVIAGWAADTIEGTPADEIVVVADGISVLVSPPNLLRPDVGDALGDPVYAGSGFGIELASEIVERADSIRIFAVKRGIAATELSLPDGAFS